MKAKPGELKMGWSRRERDIQFAWGGEGATKADSHLLHSALCSKRMTVDFPDTGHKWISSLMDELEARGYDITTLRFSIKRTSREHGREQNYELANRTSVSD